MSTETNEDVYAQFGVKADAISSGLSEHDHAMIQLDTDVRDGDDQINTVFEEEEGEQQEDTNVEESPKEEVQLEGQEESIVIKEVPELSTALKDLNDNLEGFEEMKASAIERGLDESMLALIEAEYEAGEGLSAKSYDALAKAGYSKGFVDSYLRGQEAMVSQYIGSIYAMAGGETKFNAIVAHLEANGGSEGLYDAIENRNVSTIKTIMSLAAASRTKDFGKAPARSIANKAVPAAPAKSKVPAFESRDAMVKAMSDPRYSHDASYRKAVENMVAMSNF